MGLTVPHWCNWSLLPKMVMQLLKFIEIIETASYEQKWSIRGQNERFLLFSNLRYPPSLNHGLGHLGQYGLVRPIKIFGPVDEIRSVGGNKALNQKCLKMS